jgi:hypothetical protein
MGTPQEKPLIGVTELRAPITQTVEGAAGHDDGHWLPTPRQLNFDAGFCQVDDIRQAGPGIGDGKLARHARSVHGDEHRSRT